MSALIDAVRAKDSPRVRELLTAGNDPDQRDDLEETALTWASSLGLTGVVKDLLAAGADQRLQGRQLRASPLLLAAGRVHRGIVALLLPLAELEQVDSQGRTALIAAAGLQPATPRQADAQIAVIQLLLANDANRECTDQLGRTALDVARQSGNQRLVECLISSA
jgi:hypothetical protein